MPGCRVGGGGSLSALLGLSMPLGHGVELSHFAFPLSCGSALK